MADSRTRTPASAASALKGLPPELRLAGAAAAALAFTVVLPWYQKSFFATTGARPVAISDSLSALQVFSFVEAAVLLVAAGVLYLVWARSQKKGFHLPGGDGTVIMAAGGWALLLLVWRLFDKPDVDDPGATVGVQWGIFAALLAAGALTAAGARVRAVDRPEPPNPAADEAGWERPPPSERGHAARSPREPEAVSDALSDAPGWEGEPPEAPRRTRRGGTMTAPGEAAPAPREDGDDRLF